MIQYIYVYCANAAQWNEYIEMLDTHYAESISYTLNVRERSAIAYNAYTDGMTVYLRICLETYHEDKEFIRHSACSDVVYLCDKELFNEEGDKL